MHLNEFFWRTILGVVFAMPNASMAGDAFFIELGANSEAWGVSADGSTVVGRRQTEFGWEAFAWSDGVFTGLGDFSSGEFFSQANAVSADGSVVVGFGTTQDGDEAFFWTEQSGRQPLGAGRASDVSHDGRVIAGSQVEEEVFLWTEMDGRESVGLDPAFPPKLSADGSIITGRRGARGGAWDIGDPFDPPYSLDLHIRLGGQLYVPTGVSSNGNFAVGTSGEGDRLTATTASQQDSGGVWCSCTVNDVATRTYHEGEYPVVIGSYVDLADEPIIDFLLDTVSIRDLLIADGLSEELEGWLKLGMATALSDDGRTIVGWHTDRGAWVAHLGIPEPNSCVLFVIGALAIGSISRGIPDFSTKGTPGT